ncbi:MAG: MarR family transcriptional regulator [Myxococcota bacterium]|nr:MarR family transcriptional regulator [Myxococcota bacterium]
MDANENEVSDSIEIVEELVQELRQQIEFLNGVPVQEDISYGQYKVISVIHSHGPISVGKLGRQVGTAQSTTSEMVARLAKAGIITKVKGPYDGRIIMLELTDQGRRLIRKHRKRVRETYQSLLSNLTEHEKASLKEYIKKLNALLARGLNK